jgi:hypothetical protein
MDWSVFMTKELDREWQYARFVDEADENGQILLEFSISVRWAHHTAVFIDAVSVTIKGGLPMDYKDELWRESIARQTVSLNPEAALQAAMFADGFTPVESEFWHAIDSVQYAAQAGERVDTGERRVYFVAVPNWNLVQWYTPSSGLQAGDTVVDLSSHQARRV